MERLSRLSGLPLLFTLVLLGALTVFGFAPFYFGIVYVVSLFVLQVLCVNRSPKQAFWRAYLWALSAFTASFYWIFHSLHDIAGLPLPIALPMTVLFPAVLALFPALSVYCWRRFSTGKPAFFVQNALLFSAFWSGFEWLRTWLFTGFSWSISGYSQVPDGLLSGWMPIVGVLGVSAMLALCVGALHTLWQTTLPSAQRVMALGVLLFFVITGVYFKEVSWTKPIPSPVSVALIQGNVAQSLKWQPDQVESTLTHYGDLIASTQAQLIVLPETALPLFWHEVPYAWRAEIERYLVSHRQEAVAGVPIFAQNEAFNGVISLRDPALQYYKSHLVPFGEFIPLPWLTGWLYRMMDMPMSGFSSGSSEQMPLSLLNQKVAFNICYEDSFGDELIFAAKQATILANVSNLAWFGESNAAAQHVQLSQARALEFERPVIRATNSGGTVIIDEKGTLQASAPEWETFVLEGKVTGRTGLTPYLRFGNFWVLLWIFGTPIAYRFWQRRRGAL